MELLLNLSIFSGPYAHVFVDQFDGFGPEHVPHCNNLKRSSGIVNANDHCQEWLEP
jgi:hypothetical protein